MYYVYILESATGDLYFGSTNDLTKRLSQHSNGRVISTKGANWDLAYYEAYRAGSDARRREQQIKQHGQSKRWLKERIKDSLKAKVSAGYTL